MSTDEKWLAATTPAFYRRRDSANLFSVSESIIMRWERMGLLRTVKLPGIRSVRHTREDVEALAGKIRSGEL